MNQIEAEMEKWRGLGLVATRDDIFSTYVTVMKAETGSFRDDIIDDYLDATECLPRAAGTREA